MGATDSNLTREERIDNDYKLIRRYTCPCYGELTVIQDKKTKKLYALKEYVSEQESFLSRIKVRKEFRHPNLVCLANYWVQNQNSLCSNLKKIGVLFDYYEKSLQQQICQQVQNCEQALFKDDELTQMIWQFIDCLSYLEQRGIKFLLGGLRSVKVLAQNNRKLIKLLESEESLMFDDKNAMSQIMHCHSGKRQIPLHPSYQRPEYGNFAFSKEELTSQNIFTVGIIILCLALVRLPGELGIFHKGVYDFDKLNQRKQQIGQAFPKTQFHLNQMLKKKFYKNIKYENFLGSYEITATKQKTDNFFSIKDFKVMPIYKIEPSSSSKKLNPLKIRNYIN